jgi:hypothetical protein
VGEGPGVLFLSPLPVGEGPGVLFLSPLPVGEGPGVRVQIKQNRQPRLAVVCRESESVRDYPTRRRAVPRRRPYLGRPRINIENRASNEKFMPPV